MRHLIPQKELSYRDVKVDHEGSICPNCGVGRFAYAGWQDERDLILTCPNCYKQWRN